MAVSKVSYGGNTLIDLTGDTITADTLLSGITAHGADGEPIIGENPYEKTATNTEVNTQAQLISQIAQALEGKSVEGGGTGGIVPSGELDIDENGRYDVTEYATVDVNVPDTPAKLVEGQIFRNNGTYDVPSGYDGFSHVVVNVPTSGDGGGLPSGITAFNSGTIRLDTEHDDFVVINHGLGAAPDFYYIFACEEFNANDSVGCIYSISFVRNRTIRNDVVSEGRGMYVYISTSNASYGSIALASSQANSESIDIYPGAVYKLKSGMTYRWIAGIVEELN